ncbi:MAG: bifunctional aspartate kinase/homoserine dehydrogenase I, partial [Bacteroidales bacterium]|nr:bifunctional aspartate kinase/homoserine dehydrogenase I [Bacteroidales bacterium]
MKVLKFGGSYLENPGSIETVKSIVESVEGPVVVVIQEGWAKALRDAIPGSVLRNPQTYLGGHPEVMMPRSDKAVVPGIIPDGFDPGELTDLEKGRADYLASLIAASNDAECLEIWTDVDGMMTADPSAVKTAYVIEEMTYGEAMELCNFGVKTIYSPALFPVNSKGIPLVIKNIHNPSGKGTTIRRECKAGARSIRGISSIDDVSLITLSGTSMAGLVGVNCRIFTALALERISAFLVCQSASETGISIGVSHQDALKAKEVLDGTFAREIRNG